MMLVIAAFTDYVLRSSTNPLIVRNSFERIVFERHLRLRMQSPRSEYPRVDISSKLYAQIKRFSPRLPLFSGHGIIIFCCQITLKIILQVNMDTHALALRIA